MSSCPVCGGPLPAPLPTGQAARLLEYAENVEASIGKPAFGSEAYLRGRVAGLRADAAELLVSVGRTESS